MQKHLCSILLNNLNFKKMKKYLIMLLCAAFMSISVYAQKISADKVPAAASSAFKSKFPGATKVGWELENVNEYEAEFKLNGEEMSASYDKEGKWMETETEIKVSALPAAIQSALKKNFAEFKVKEASKIESAKNGNCFEAEIEKGKESYEALFTPEGKLLSKTKKEEKKEEKKKK